MKTSNAALKLERTLTPLQQLLSLNNEGKQRPTVPYRTELMQEFGSIEAALLFQQIIYMWHSFDRRPFYMFHLPPKKDDSWYNEDRGNSWNDMFGLSKYKINEALKEFAVKTSKHKLEKKMESENSPVWYYTDRTNRTWYVVDEEATIRLLCDIYDINPTAILGDQDDEDQDNESDDSVQQSGKTDSNRGKSESKESNFLKSKNFTSGNEGSCSRNNTKSLHIDSSKSNNPPKPPSSKNHGMDGILNIFKKHFGKKPDNSTKNQNMICPILETHGYDKCKQAIINCASMPTNKWRNFKARGSVTTIFRDESTFKKWLNYSVNDDKADDTPEHYVPLKSNSDPLPKAPVLQPQEPETPVRSSIATAKTFNLSESTLAMLNGFTQ